MAVLWVWVRVSRLFYILMQTEVKQSSRKEENLVLLTSSESIFTNKMNESSLQPVDNEILDVHLKKILFYR